jgi:hypothetical protein
MRRHTPITALVTSAVSQPSAINFSGNVITRTLAVTVSPIVDNRSRPGQWRAPSKVTDHIAIGSSRLQPPGVGHLTQLVHLHDVDAEHHRVERLALDSFRVPEHVQQDDSPSGESKRERHIRAWSANRLEPMHQRACSRCWRPRLFWVSNSSMGNSCRASIPRVDRY